MPEKRTIQKARQAKREGKAPTTQAGEFIREEFDHIRDGKHGARSPEQAIAIGLSKARRAGVQLPPPKRGHASEETRKAAARDYLQGARGGDHAKSMTRSSEPSRVSRLPSVTSAPSSSSSGTDPSEGRSSNLPRNAD